MARGTAFPFFFANVWLELLPPAQTSGIVGDDVLVLYCFVEVASYCLRLDRYDRHCQRRTTTGLELAVGY